MSFESPVAKREGKLSVCPWPGCEKKFLRPAHLQIHLRVHTGERPYTCQNCGKSWTQKSALKQHSRVHTGEKPFRCLLSTCGRAFSSSSSRNRHMKTHEEKPSYSNNNSSKESSSPPISSPPQNFDFLAVRSSQKLSLNPIEFSLNDYPQQSTPLFYEFSPSSPQSSVSLAIERLARKHCDILGRMSLLKPPKQNEVQKYFGSTI